MAVEPVEIVLQGVDNASGTIDKVNQKLVASEEKYISKLKEQLIALQEGAAAAEQFKLAEMGFSEETIKSAAAIREQIEAIKSHGKEIEDTGQKVEKTGKSAESVIGGLFSAGGFNDALIDLEGIGDTLESLSPRAAGLANAIKQLAPAALGFATAWASLEIGRQFGEWITGAQDFRDELQRVQNQMNDMREQERQQRGSAIDRDVQLANIAPSEEARSKQLDEVQAKIQRNMELEAQGVFDQIEYVNQLREEYANASRIDQEAIGQRMQMAVDDLNARTASLQQLKDKQAELNEERKQEEEIAKRTAIVDQQRRLDDFIRSTRQETEKLNQEAETAEQRRAREVQQLQQMLVSTQNLSAADRAVAEAALRGQHAAEREAEARAESAKLWDQFSKELEASTQASQDYLRGLELQNTELTKGKRAAEELKASWQGVSQYTIEAGREMAIQNELLVAQKQLADEEKKKEEELQKKLGTPTPQLQATQSRLLTRSGVNPNDRAVKASEKTVELTAKIEQLQRELLAEQRKQKGGIIEIISRP